jgi:hypothetical protein
MAGMAGVCLKTVHSPRVRPFSRAKGSCFPLGVWGWTCVRWSVECGVQGVVCSVESVGCKVWNVKRGVGSVECGLSDAEKSA